MRWRSHSVVTGTIDMDRIVVCTDPALLGDKSVSFLGGDQDWTAGNSGLAQEPMRSKYYPQELSKDMAAPD